MIGWVNAMALAWGYQLRRHMKGPFDDLPCIIGRLMEEGEGASIRSFQQHYPEGLLGVALEIHVGWQHIPYHPRRFMVIHYVCDGPAKRKERFLGISHKTYYNRLHAAHLEMQKVLLAPPAQCHPTQPDALSV